MKLRRLTKASVIRALERHGACPKAIQWFKRQPSLKAAWTILLHRGGLRSDNPYAERRCWVQSVLNHHTAVRTGVRWGSCNAWPASYTGIRNAAIRKGWTR